MYAIRSYYDVFGSACTQNLENFFSVFVAVDSACYNARTMNQALALEVLKTGANVFLTGEPGAGKTYA